MKINKAINLKSLTMIKNVKYYLQNKFNLKLKINKKVLIAVKMSIYLSI